MKNTTLVIMAAGIGSRFGGGIKQLEPVGPNKEIIMDYSIYDAIEAGFDKVVFVIRKDLEETFKEVIGNRIEKVIPVEYAFQELAHLPAGFTVPQGRTKPWGTGQAILACKGHVNEPFLVINADDYYGKSSFKKMHDYLVGEHDTQGYDICMAGFILGNTLSDNGKVTRGVCVLDEEGYLAGVNETGGIIRTAVGVETGGLVRTEVVVLGERQGEKVRLDENSHVSMNMWGFTPDFLEVLEQGFAEFLQALDGDGTTQEYLLPGVVDGLIKAGKTKVAVIETQDKWFGVTYKEDKQSVVDSIRGLIEQGLYPEHLYQ